VSLVSISGHTIEKSLLGSGLIIDVGCRGFEFAKYFNPSRTIICIDPDPNVFKENGLRENFECFNLAISNKSGEADYYRNGEMTCLCEIMKPLPHLIEKCKAITISELYKTLPSQQIDVLKLDCEGAEYLILSDPDFEPLPTQITVEFHEHFVPEYHNRMIKDVMQNLLRSYDCIYSHENGMDNLFVKK
jgi:FkbM family methyltransferase